MDKPCGRCGVTIHATGNRRFCATCRPIHDREQKRATAARERSAKPDQAKARQRRYREANGDALRAKARVRSADRRAEIAAWRNLARFGGVGVEVLQRDGWQCRLCGAEGTDGFRNLTIHHIDGTKTNNVAANLITLCRTCHPTVHNRWHGAIRQDELRTLVAQSEES